MARTAAGGAPGALASLRGTAQEALAVGGTPCGYLHPGRSCSGHTAAFLPRAYLRAMPV